jgi:D-alanyl-D-alanine carboxypeptidase
MNQDQLGGILRAIVPPLVTWLVAKNIVPAGSADSIISAAVAVAAAAWSVVSNKTGKVIGGK